MRYEISDRVQGIESYCCIPHFILDVLETLMDEELDMEQVNIISDKYMVEKLIKIICQASLDNFEFNLALVDFNRYDDSIDEYVITILYNGEVYVEPAIDKNAEYYDCDGFMFVESNVSEDAYVGNNRGNDVMRFNIEELD